MYYRSLLSVCFALIVTSSPCAALAWGTTGHREVNLDAARSLPPSLPAFLRTPQAIAEIEALGPEEDRLKGSGESWDRDNDPAHFADIGDDGTIFGSKLDALPVDMPAYARLLATLQSDPYRAGYLPYSIADGFEQLRMDFAYWRAFDYLASHGAEGDRAAYATARDLRQDLILRDIGVWGHFVGDGSQPLHVTIHYNGWGTYPNPNNYTTEKIHSLFEGAFVRDHVTADAVFQLLSAPPPTPPMALLTQEQILAMTGAYLKATAANVTTLYTIEKAGGFKSGSPEAIAFTTARVADGARELRDLITLAWDNSQYSSIGYPPIPVQSILSGAIAPGPGAFGSD